jgi:soluble lytic murein transglycosylase-like protein
MSGDPTIQGGGKPPSARPVPRFAAAVAVLWALAWPGAEVRQAAAEPEASAPVVAPEVAPVVATVVEGLRGPEPFETAPLAPANTPLATASDIPRVLSATDIARYRGIFALQREQEWRAAELEAQGLDDRLLMGHVRFERYMHPTGYRSKYPELYAWLEAYGDQPGARRVYRLALKRHQSGWKRPKAPEVAKHRRPPKAARAASPPTTAKTPSATRKRTKAQARMARRLARKLDRYLARDKISAAENLLRHKQVRRMLGERELDAGRAKVAAALYYAGRDAKALKLAQVATRSRAEVPLADWTAGLAAWRLGQRERAGGHFQALARSTAASPWNVAAGAYWAARAMAASGARQERERLLEIAAAHGRTFYGLLAGRVLASDTPFAWRQPPLGRDEVARLMEIPAVRRALALAEVGRHGLAQEEIDLLRRGADAPLARTLLALASRLGMAAIQMRLADKLIDAKSPYFDSVNYPLSPWRPETGLKLDRALLHAFMRQESRFSNWARSHKGARGLMQLMPLTASEVAGDRSLAGRNKQKLFSPEFNLDLGQSYLMKLIDSELVRGNLVLLAAAYNAGPGNLKRWLKTIRDGDDPLLFLESVPVLETRLFMERVITNFWIYRHRLGQDSPSLDAVASGNWPYYVTLDRRLITVASNVRR